jgi:uncharacterized protein (DUF433 family)
MISSSYHHIQLNDQNVPLIGGTTMKVIELVTAQQAYGWSPEELHLQYPHLSMSQIHSALAYYWDHKDEIDADIQHRFELLSKLRRHTIHMNITSTINYARS